MFQAGEAERGALCGGFLLSVLVSDGVGGSSPQPQEGLRARGGGLLAQDLWRAAPPWGPSASGVQWCVSKLKFLLTFPNPPLFFSSQAFGKSGSFPLVFESIPPTPPVL